jgi:hypothetical protein
MNTASLIVAAAGMLFAIFNYLLSFIICKNLWILDPAFCHSIQAPRPELGYWLAITKKHRNFDRMLSSGAVPTTFPQIPKIYCNLWILSRWTTRIAVLIILVVLVF